MELSNKICKLRKNRGWTQEELADRLNVSRQAVSRWENGTAQPDAQNVLQLSKLFGITTDYLLNDDYISDESCFSFQTALQEIDTTLPAEVRPENLPDKIGKLRKNSNWSQQELADRLNISRQAVSRWENGTALPDAQNVLQLSKLFGVTADYLLKDECKDDEDISTVPAVEKEDEDLLPDKKSLFNWGELLDRIMFPTKEQYYPAKVICCAILIFCLVMCIGGWIEDLLPWKRSVVILNNDRPAVTEETVPETAAVPVEESIEGSLKKPTEEPAEAPTEEPAEAPTEAPAEEPAEAPTEAPVIAYDDRIIVPLGGTLDEDIDSLKGSWVVAGERAAEWSVLGSDLQRKQISTITFVDTLSVAGENAWDVSLTKDRSVLAWTEKRDGLYDLYIGAEGGVTAPDNCESLFAGYTNVTRISFAGNFDTSDTVSFRELLYGCNSLVQVDVNTLDVSSAEDMSLMFAYCQSLGKLDLSGWNTASVRNMNLMLFHCAALERLDLSMLNTSSVTDMSGMFSGCDRLCQLDLSGFDTSSVKNMSTMFSNCEYLERLDLSGFDTSSVTDMSQMFNYCTRLKQMDLSGWNMAAVEDMSLMFSNCLSLEKVDLSGVNASSVEKMNAMFQHCYALNQVDFSGFYAPSVRSMSYMFLHCYKLSQLNLSGFNIASVIDMSYMFYDCSTIKNIDVSGFDTSFVTDMSYMFFKCKELEQLDLSGWDTPFVTNMSSMFSYCDSLKELNLSSLDTSRVENVEYMFYGTKGVQPKDLEHLDFSSVSKNTFFMIGSDWKYLFED